MLYKVVPDMNETLEDIQEGSTSMWNYLVQESLNYTTTKGFPCSYYSFPDYNYSHLLHNSSQVLNHVIRSEVLPLNNTQRSLHTEPAVVWVSGEAFHKLSLFAGIWHAH